MRAACALPDHRNQPRAGVFRGRKLALRRPSADGWGPSEPMRAEEGNSAATLHLCRSAVKGTKQGQGALELLDRVGEQLLLEVRREESRGRLAVGDLPQEVAKKRGDLRLAVYDWLLGRRHERGVVEACHVMRDTLGVRTGQVRE